MKIWSLQRKMDGNELLARAWKPKKLCSMSSMSDFISTLHSKTLFRCKALLPFFSFHPSLCTSSLSSVQIFKVFKDRVSKHKSPCVQHTCQDLWYSCMILHLLASKKHNNTTYGHLDVCPWHGFPSPGCGRPRRNDTTWPPMPRWKERTSWLRKLLGNSEYFFKLTNGYKNAGGRWSMESWKPWLFGGSLLNIFQQQELQKENTQKNFDSNCLGSSHKKKDFIHFSQDFPSGLKTTTTTTPRLAVQYQKLEVVQCPVHASVETPRRLVAWCSVRWKLITERIKSLQHIDEKSSKS